MPIRHKGLLVILDGLGDRPSAAMGGATPLEAARTPHLDQLANSGSCGLIDPLIPGVPVGTHTGTGLLLGLSPGDALELNRGPVEAAGIGMPVAPGDVLLRSNFATIEKKSGQGFRVLDRRAGRIQKDTLALSEVLQDIPVGEGIRASLRPATQHRAVLRLTGKKLSAAVTDTDAGSRSEILGVLPCAPLDPQDAAAVTTAEAVNRFIHEAYERLRDHPVNHQRQAQGLLPASGILTRGAGNATRLRSIIEHLGLKAAVVAGESTVLGLAKLLNYTPISQPSFTSLVGTDLDAKVAAAHAALATHDLVFLHIKGTDICAHDYNASGKRDFLERIDDALTPLLNEELIIGVTGDHSTDSNTGRHTGDPVPSLLYAPLGRVDGCQRFGEKYCVSGGLGRIASTSFLASLLGLMGALPNYRPADKAYFTADG